MVKGRLHSIESFGSLDGPGIRTIFFLQGCPARCSYCHNPDTWNFTGCREIIVEEIVEKAKRSLNYYGKDGGVTFSGGEPLLQGAFLYEAMMALKEEGIRSVIDTSATHVDEFTERCVKEAQMILLDIKHSDPEKFEEVCGIKQDSLLKLIDIANRNDIAVWTRQVIVPGFNDSSENIKELAAFIDEKIKHLYKAELLGYHTMALKKYEKLGIPYKLEGVKALDKDVLARLQNELDDELARLKNKG